MSKSIIHIFDREGDNVIEIHGQTSGAPIDSLAEAFQMAEAFCETQLIVTIDEIADCPYSQRTRLEKNQAYWKAEMLHYSRCLEAMKAIRT